MLRVFSANKTSATRAENQAHVWAPGTALFFSFFSFAVDVATQEFQSNERDQAGKWLSRGNVTFL